MPTYVSKIVVAPMLNLENLRKQAKLYLRWHRDGYHPVAATIRAMLPRYKHLTDRQVLAERFKLSDTQELVARQSGFESWQALKSGVQAMPATTNPTVSIPVLSDVETQFYVSDVKASCDYYTKPGFTVAFTYGEPVFVGDIREREKLLSASITVDSADEIHRLFDQYKSAGVDFNQTLKKEPWGARTFIVRDPDGNLLLFAGPAA